jgi:hypothetical protein
VTCQHLTFSENLFIYVEAPVRIPGNFNSFNRSLSPEIERIFQPRLIEFYVFRTQCLHDPSPKTALEWLLLRIHAEGLQGSSPRVVRHPALNQVPRNRQSIRIPDLRKENASSHRNRQGTPSERILTRADFLPPAPPSLDLTLPLVRVSDQSGFGYPEFRHAGVKMICWVHYTLLIRLSRIKIANRRSTWDVSTLLK